MTEVRFYHMERHRLEDVLPALLSKALQNNHKILVKAANDQDAERLNERLWTYRPNAFLPHGSKKDGYAEHQPVWLTATDENPNGADVLVLCQGTESAEMETFSLCCEMLDGTDENAVKAARERWKAYKEKGFEVTYWQQTGKGWEKKSG